MTRFESFERAENCSASTHPAVAVLRLLAYRPFLGGGTPPLMSLGRGLEHLDRGLQDIEPVGFKRPWIFIAMEAAQFPSYRSCGFIPIESASASELAKPRDRHD